MKHKILALVFFLLGAVFFYIFASYVELNSDFTVWIWLHIAQACFFVSIHFLGRFQKK